MGQKAKGLYELMKRGHKVPPFILISWHEIHGILKKYIADYDQRMALWKSIDFDDLSELPIQLKLFSSDISKIKFDSADSDKFKNLWKKCHFNSWIFRPSVSCEDLSVHSFAGCFESYSGCSTELGVLNESLLKCISSAFAPHSLIQILSEGIDPIELNIQIIFQNKIQGIFAGTLTNVNLLKISENPFLINNEGEINHYVEFVEGDGSFLAQGTSLSVIKTSRTEAKINVQYPFLKKLWSHFDKILKYHKDPIEVEWVIDNRNEIWFLQWRPLVSQEILLRNKIEKGTQWSREKTMERFPEALTPMGWSVLKDLFQKNLDDLHELLCLQKKSVEQVAAFYKNLVYHDKVYFDFQSKLPIDFIKLIKNRRFYSVINNLFLFIFKGLTWWRYFSTVALLQVYFEQDWSKLDQIWDDRNSENKENWFKFREKLELWNPEHNSDILFWINEHEKLSHKFLEDDLLITVMKDALWKGFVKGLAIHKMSEFEIASTFGKLKSNASVMASLKWVHLKDNIERDPNYSVFYYKLSKCKNKKYLRDVVCDLQLTNQELLLNYFNQEAYSRTTWDLLVPTLIDDPSLMVSMLIHPTELNNRKGNGKDELSKSVDLPMNSSFLQLISKYPDLKLAYKQLQRLMQFDEEQHVNGYLIAGTSRMLLLKVGAYLCSREVFKKSEDIFFLTFDELKYWLNKDYFINLSLLIKRRRREFFKNKDLAKNLNFNNKIKMTSKVVQGESRSPGISEGILYRIESLSDWSQLPENAIIYVHSPEPSLAVLFHRISGIVTQTGGLLSHGFVSAREYGVPGIAGVSFNNDFLTNGLPVRIDGTKGTLEVLH